MSVAARFNDSRIRLVYGTENLRLPARLNQAVQLSRGDFFARMDGDDISYPHRLEKQIDYLQTHPKVDLLGGAISIFAGNGELLGIRPGAGDHNEICGLPHRPWKAFHLAHVTWMARTDWFRRHPYDPSMFAAQDRDLLARTFLDSRFHSLADVLVGVREDHITLRKTMPARIQFIRSLLHAGSHAKLYGWATKAVAAEGCKAILDAMAVVSGLKYKLLRHRVGSFDQRHVEEWHSVWRHLECSNELVPSIL
jgi:glycosyltransferase involved in cell wall biosynthesis